MDFARLGEEHLKGLIDNSIGFYFARDVEE